MCDALKELMADELNENWEFPTTQYMNGYLIHTIYLTMKSTITFQPNQY